MNKIIKISAFLLTTGIAMAQNPSMIYYKGLGRSLMDLDKINEKSNFMKNDTTSERRDLNGLFLFDLGVNIEPNEQLKATCIMRLSNPFGAFYSFGSLFRFRQVSIEGILAKKFYYKIGDMDQRLTPYTMWNNADTWYEYEGKIFSDRREIMQYENFNNGNNWRVQGVYLKTGWNFKKYVDSINVTGFTVRTNKSNYLTVPDRLLSAANISLIGKKWLDAGARVIQHYDVAGTSNDTVSKKYLNTVASADIALKHSTENFDTRLSSEFGFSKYEKKIKGASNQTADNFFDLKLNVKHKRTGAFLQGIYRQVGTEFTSAAAQTRRVNDSYSTSGFFSTGQNGALQRTNSYDSLANNQSLYERLQYTSLYNYNITDGFSSYFIPYNIINPYGDATPNRRGVKFTVGLDRPDSLFSGKVFVSNQKEITPIGVDSGETNLRQFVEYGLGFRAPLHKYLKLKNQIILTAGYKNSHVKREGDAKIDLKADYIDLGAQIEVFKQVDLLVGYKAFAAKGTELVQNRDKVNKYVQASPLTDYKVYDFSENNFAFGAKYRLSTMSYVTCTYSMPSFKNKLSDKYNYNYNQIFVNFTIHF